MNDVGFDTAMTLKNFSEWSEEIEREIQKHVDVLERTLKETSHHVDSAFLLAGGDWGYTNDTEVHPPMLGALAEEIVFFLLAAILFVFGLVANLTIIVRITRQGVLKARIRMLLLCLSMANMLSLLLEFPMNQFAWPLLHYWPGGNWSCKLFSFFRMFAAYFVSFILVSIR